MSDGGVTTENVQQQMEEPFLPRDGADGLMEESFLARGGADRHSQEPFLSQSDPNTDETFLPQTDHRLLEDRYISRRGSERLIDETSASYPGRLRRADQSRRPSQSHRGELASDSRSSDPFHLLSNSDNEYSDVAGSGSGISVSRQTQIF